MIGTHLAHYEITTHLGTGGMGEVYQATDSKLGRSVAIKLLPEAFNQDSDRVARFEREARVLASLNHPNIAAIYGLEESRGRRFLVMELVGGETIAERIKRGAIPVDGSLAIATAICEALEAAHEKGIIHRDLKPANIKLTPHGKVKVLDFGLAKAYETNPSHTDVSNSPTIAATNAGVILGTAAYMSPEQAKGKEVDRRTDIFALGAVLYEMLTGRKAFEGEDIADILSHVLRSDPDWKLLPTNVPLRIRELLRLCLQKDSRKRRQTATDVRIDLEHTEALPEAAIPGSPAARRYPLVWLITATAVLMAVVLSIPALRHLRETPPAETRTEIVTPAGDSAPNSFALSNDGRQIVFVASGNGASSLWLRSLSQTVAQPLAGTEGASSPFWAPDSSFVGFFAGGELKKIDTAGGVPQTLARVNASGGGTSNGDVILFGATEGSPLLRVQASGGETVAVTTLDRQTSHRSPFFLPGGRQFLFYAPEKAFGLPPNPPERAGIFLGSLDSAETHRLTAADAAGVYLSSGWLLWMRGGALVAQRLDLETKTVIGDPITLAPVAFNAQTGLAAVSVSATGLIAYRSGSARRQLTWVDRSGKVLGTMGAPDEQDLSNPNLSPDGRQVAVSRAQFGNIDIWLMDGTRRSRFTTDAGRDSYPIWSPDGLRIVFKSNRKGQGDLYEKPTMGDAEELLVKSPEEKTPTHWSKSGRFILYFNAGQSTGRDLWVLREGDRKAWQFVNTPTFQERFGEFSRDERWVAYMSNESGRQEIYIRPFTAPVASGLSENAGAKPVSTAGGVFPRWSRDGNELYYLAPSGEMMAVSITITGTAMKLGTPTPLFPTRIVGGGADTGQGRQYDVSDDGRFLINTVLDGDSSFITLVQNWKPPAK